MSSSGAFGARSARWRSTSSDGSSAQWTSSSTTMSGRRATSVKTAPATASTARKRSCGDSTSPTAGSAAPRLRNTSRHGQNAGAPSVSAHRPHAKRTSAASPASSWQRRVLPIPASPTQSTSRPWPPRASSSQPRSASRSRARPSRGGVIMAHSMPQASRRTEREDPNRCAELDASGKPAHQRIDHARRRRAGAGEPRGGTRRVGRPPSSPPRTGRSRPRFATGGQAHPSPGNRRWRRRRLWGRGSTGARVNSLRAGCQAVFGCWRDRHRQGERHGRLGPETVQSGAAKLLGRSAPRTRRRSRSRSG
jgi:hypothetical protein